MAADPSTEAHLRTQVAAACKILFRLGLADYLGHPSARVPGTDRIIIKPRHSMRVHGMGDLGPEQMVVIDLEGNQLEGDDPAPGERFIHTEIYKARPDVMGIVHTHQSMSTVFGIVSRPILPILHVEAPLVARGIPIYPSPELVSTPQQGAALANALGDYALAHLQGHGIVTVSPTVEEATLAAIHMERLARANYMAAQLGEPRVISPEEIERLAGPMVGFQVRWSYYVDLVEGATGPVNF
jgi:ribulose-5-phosphate 4-epimerase/fuculose-1-phosphate aldolase